MSSSQPYTKILTSAIPNMTVAQVRKHLSEVRKVSEQQSIYQPMFISDLLPNHPSLRIQTFCLDFQTGHHQKRHNKGHKKNKKQLHHDKQNEDDDYDDDETESDE